MTSKLGVYSIVLLQPSISPSENLGRQPCYRFQVPPVVPGEAQDQVAAALLHVAVQPFGRRPGRTGEAGLALLQYVGPLAVIRRQEMVDALLGPVRVFIDGERQVDRRLQRFR